MDYCGYPSAPRQKESNSPFFFLNKFVLREGGAGYGGKRAWREISRIYRIFMKFQRKYKLGLLIDTWKMFLLSNEILDAAVHVRLICCECGRQCQKPACVTPCHALALIKQRVQLCCRFQHNLCEFYFPV